MSRLATQVGHKLYTETPSSVATLDMLLPAPYRFFLLEGWLRPATDSVSMWIRFSNDGGSTYRAGASDYAWGRGVTNLSTVAVDALADTADAQIVPGTSGNLSSEYFSFEAVIRGARSSSVNTSISGTNFYVNATPTMLTGAFGGHVLVAAEVNNAVRLLFSSGNIAAGEVTLIGMP